MSTLASSFSILTQPGVFLYLLRGVAFTCILSVLGVILGLILGSLLALARTYCKKGPARILGWFSAAYIELFRNTPYLLWIFVCVVFCPCPAFFARKMFGLTSVEMKLLFKAALALILFNSSVIAEIVRGGLNGVAKGQFEAGYAQASTLRRCCCTSSCRRPTATSCPPCSARSSPPSRIPPTLPTWRPLS